MSLPVENLHRIISERQLDALLISEASNRRYISGFTGSAGYLFISQKKAILATDFRYIEQARSQAPGFRIARIVGEFMKWFPQMISELGVKRLGFESDNLTVADCHQLVRAARKLSPISRPQLIATQGIVESLRAVKDGAEIKLIEQAAALAVAACDHAAEFLRPGLTEKQLAWDLEKFMREKGSEKLPFDIIVASGPNSALPHAQPSDRIIEEGEPVVVDLGARVNGYTSDITRTICLGEPEDMFKRIYGIVQRSQQAALEGIRLGMSGDEADHLARGVIEEANYGEAFGHGLGHGVGLETHEKPLLSPNSKDMLIKGMVFTIEPGIYLPEWGGVRIEDMVLLEEKGPRILTQASKLKF